MFDRCTNSREKDVLVNLSLQPNFYQSERDLDVPVHMLMSTILKRRQSLLSAGYISEFAAFYELFKTSSLCNFYVLKHYIIRTVFSHL